MELVDNDINDLYEKLVKLVLSSGSTVSPRNLVVKEVEGVHLILTNPHSRIITNQARKEDLQFACGELLWYLSASNKLDFIKFYNKRYRNFSDNGITLHGSYGNRIFKQNNKLSCKKSSWEVAKNKLLEDQDTRQAVISIYDTFRDGVLETKDVPCTLTLQFMIRNGKLDCFVNMRSNDAIWGIPYDMFSFTTFQELMAQEIGIPVGVYHHYTSSLHIYRYHFDLAKKILNAGRFSGSSKIYLNKDSLINLRYFLNQEEELRSPQVLISNYNYELFDGMSLLLNLEMLNRNHRWREWEKYLRQLHSPFKEMVRWK